MNLLNRNEVAVRITVLAGTYPLHFLLTHSLVKPHSKYVLAKQASLPIVFELDYPPLTMCCMKNQHFRRHLMAESSETTSLLRSHVEMNSPGHSPILRLKVAPLFYTLLIG